MPPTPLQQLIIERIQRNGPITFAEFMRMALYMPDYGYYVTGPTRMGWQGDYYTSTDVSPLFANCMGRQLYQMWEQLKRPSPFVVLEQGAGRGHLAEGVRCWANHHSREDDFVAALDYRIGDLRMGQDAVAENEPSDATAQPHVILSNELVDAFPVHVLEKRNARLYEVYVHVQQDRLSEVLDEPSSPEVADYLDSYHIPWLSFNDGWRAEVNLAALRWMKCTARLLLGSSPRRKRHGFILTIDYGDRARLLYTRHRPRGTLVSYFQHQLTERPLVRPGEQDITAHVNFSALIGEGRKQGLRLHKFTTQRLWLESMGMDDELERLRTHDFAMAETQRSSNQGQIALLKWYDLRQRAATLTDPASMGNFKVLILKR
ncbi:MAG: SAM-dependent methyltransferase [Ktedonobacteraceae bacterium]|nr:SAM-dependent methyltransferase [Ktedonobacteraceae bacterium]